MRHHAPVAKDRHTVEIDPHPTHRLVIEANAHVEIGRVNVGRAAKRLGVHPNTVRYRLGRIEAIAGGSTRDFHDLVEIHTVVRLLSR